MPPLPDLPLSGLDQANARFARELRSARLMAFDAPAQGLAHCGQRMERVVNIYAEGRLAYTGFLSLAAIRLDISERALALSIDRGLTIARPPQPRFYQTPDGRWPRARTYTAKWRDA